MHCSTIVCSVFVLIATPKIFAQDSNLVSDIQTLPFQISSIDDVDDSGISENVFGDIDGDENLFVDDTQDPSNLYLLLGDSSGSCNGQQPLGRMRARSNDMCPPTNQALPHGFPSVPSTGGTALHAKPKDLDTEE